VLAVAQVVVLGVVVMGNIDIVDSDMAVGQQGSGCEMWNRGGSWGELGGCGAISSIYGSLLLGAGAHHRPQWFPE
jgi:hypothetical protein